jgi:hypothetical protein
MSGLVNSEGFKFGAAYRALKHAAESRGLIVSPPYADAKAREAFTNGYESALSDVALGRLPVPSPETP